MIHVDNLVKRYRKAKINAVDSVSFDVPEGEFFAFLGPNGAGKTTTISILTTILSKTSGEVTIGGFDVETQASLVRQNSGIIFQNPSLDQNLSAEENIRFHAVLYGLYPFRPLYSMMPQEYKTRVQELAAVLGIEKEINKPVKTFSGGMKRKLEIIRSLMHNPKVLFLDEPTSGLDPASRKSLWEYLQKVRKENGTTVFLTTHYLEEAEGADHVVVINKGKVIIDSTPEQMKRELVNEYLLVDSAAQSELEAELKKLNLKYEIDGGFKIELEQDGGKVQEIIQSIHTKLNKVQVHLPSLEEAYIEIINQSNQTEEEAK